MMSFRLHQVWQLLMVVTFSILLAGCPSGSALDGANVQNGTFVETGKGEGVGGAAAANAQKIFATNASAAPATDSEDYKISPLDVVEITVFNVTDLNRTVQVSTSGMITLPLINSVRAGGRTAGQLERDIASKLEANYLQSPQVSVFVKEYNSQRVTVDGEVKKPGIYPINGRVSLLQAIALAEGFSELADPSGVILFRTVNNKRMAARFDVTQVRGGKVQDPMLQAGDIVMVDQSAAKTTLKEIKEALPLSGVFRLFLI